MSKLMQNLVVFMEPSEDSSNVSLKAGNLYLNRFCIDEAAAFELSGVHYLQKSSDFNSWDEREIESKSKEKGKEFYTLIVLF